MGVLWGVLWVCCGRAMGVPREGRIRGRPVLVFLVGVIFEISANSQGLHSEGKYFKKAASNAAMVLGWSSLTSAL